MCVVAKVEFTDPSFIKFYCEIGGKGGDVVFTVKIELMVGVKSGCQTNLDCYLPFLFASFINSFSY